MKRNNQKSISDFFQKKPKSSPIAIVQNVVENCEPTVLQSLAPQCEPTVLQSQVPHSSAAASSSTFTPSDLSSGLHQPPTQPVIPIFPITNGRRFNPRYYDKYQWLEYSCEADSVFCYYCRHLTKKSELRPGEKIGCRPFIENGFKKWKDTSDLLSQHEKGIRHKNASTSYVEFIGRSGSNNSVASILVGQRTEDINENREHVKALLRATSYLCRQKLAFRGHRETEASDNKGNFVELLEMIAQTDKKLAGKLAQRYGHYTSPVYQNDLISVIANKLRKIISEEVVKSGFFSISADETKDASKSEQMSVLVRYVDMTGEASIIKERALGVYHLKEFGAEAISSEIIKIIKESGLDINLCVGQCYDGANTMRGHISGVQTRIKEVVPHAYYLHCYAHQLNLVLVHTLGDISKIFDFFKVTQNLYNFIANSGNRHERFVATQTRLQQTVLKLERTSTTRWFYWYYAVKKIKKRLAAILLVLETEEDDRVESMGIIAQLEKPSFLFLLVALHKLLKITYNLSQELQREELHLAKSVVLIKCTKTELEKNRTAKVFSEVSNEAKDLAESVGCCASLKVVSFNQV